MPFKLTEQERLEARKVLRAARELLPGKWCRGADALSESWQETLTSSDDAVHFCVVGALRRASRDTEGNVLPALDLLYTAMCDRYPWNREEPAPLPNHRADLLREWNDGAARDLDEVMKLFDHALLLAE
jgi:hypothetical protein